jgi:hypothetical protein
MHQANSIPHDLIFLQKGPEFICIYMYVHVDTIMESKLPLRLLIYYCD